MEQANVERLKQKLEVQQHETLQFLRLFEQEVHSLDVDAAHEVADRSVISVSKESLFERGSQRRTVLRLIQAALERIADGSFGTCLGCGDEIDSRRLEALPWTQFCRPCQGELEEKIGASLSTKISAPLGSTWRRAG